jgi:hypothetical protein
MELVYASAIFKIVISPSSLFPSSYSKSIYTNKMLYPTKSCSRKLESIIIIVIIIARTHVSSLFQVTAVEPSAKCSNPPHALPACTASPCSHSTPFHSSPILHYP